MYIGAALLILAICEGALYDVVFSILVGNMPNKSYKNAKKHAREIRAKQSVWARMTQTYIGEYTKKFSWQYKMYMAMKMIVFISRRCCCALVS